TPKTTGPRSVQSLATCEVRSWSYDGAGREFALELVGESTRVALIVQHARRQENKQFGARGVFTPGGEQSAENRDFLEQRYAGIIPEFLVADESGKTDGFAILDDDPRLDPALLESRRIDRGRGCRYNVTDFLLDIEGHQPAGIDARRH